MKAINTGQPKEKRPDGRMFNIRSKQKMMNEIQSIDKRSKNMELKHEFRSKSKKVNGIYYLDEIDPGAQTLHGNDGSRTYDRQGPNKFERRTTFAQKSATFEEKNAEASGVVIDDGGGSEVAIDDGGGSEVVIDDGGGSEVVIDDGGGSEVGIDDGGGSEVGIDDRETQDRT
jgi:hypothetical protein